MAAIEQEAAKIVYTAGRGAASVVAPETAMRYLLVCLCALPCLGQDQLIPFHKLDAQYKRKVEDVYYAPTVRLVKDPRQVACDVATFDWVLDRLPLAADLARAMELGDYGVVPNPDEEGALDIDDREGALATIRITYQQEDIRVYLADGTLESRVLPAVDGTGVIVVVYGDAYEGEGIEAELSVFFRLKSNFLHLVTRAFKDTLARELDRRLLRLIDTAMSLAEAIAADPAAVFATLEGIEGVPEETLADYRARFLD